MRQEYIALLGGTGFSEKSPWLRRGVGIAKRTQVVLVTSGMGFEHGLFERDYVAGYAEAHGIPKDKIIRGVDGDPDNRSTRDDILQTLNSIPWDSLTKPPRIVFLTEGLLHSWRVKGYAIHQMPKGRQAEIHCLDYGVKIDWLRRTHEIISFAKYLFWLFKKRIKAA